MVAESRSYLIIDVGKEGIKVILELLPDNIDMVCIVSVRRLESDLQGVLDEVAREEFGREMHTFPYRRLGAS